MLQVQSEVGKFDALRKRGTMGSKAMFKWAKTVTPSHVEQLIQAERDINKALLIFDSATSEYANGFKHDLNTFRLMISKLVSANQFRSAETLLDRMNEEKFDVTEDIFLTICRAYGRVHKPLDSIRIFHKMEDFQCKPTEKSYITVFAILVEENQLKLALRFYRYMRKMGFPPTVASLNVLIKAFCKNSGTMDKAMHILREMSNHGCEPDSYTYGTLINGLCKLGKIVEAKELLQEMETKGCSPSVVTYTSLIHGLCQLNNVDEAVGLLEDMMGKGIEPNVFTYSSLMDGFCKAGHSSRARDLLELMVQKRLRPNMISYSTLINGLCKEGKLNEALEILDRMKLQGLKPDAGLYGKIVNGLCDTSRFQEAANFLDEMVLGGITPNRVTWSLHVRTHNRVIDGLCTINDSSRAFQLYLSVQTRGISITVDTFDGLLKCFCKKRDLQKTYRILDEMVINGCIPQRELWSTVVNCFCDQRKTCDALKLLQLELMS
ncbi:pentatricopeptide repeat-containing protein At5g46100 isoform X1 [Momordica charantia]|uniref:Pentatricopeptide repeat-containing protein At5g46100 isoform X1 n=2 Tax=Momordica charantia TaxID=3673 RepID=A0A6J1CDW1_MOMCH|nr:pentatricopeptide repeat-containing protein At5g46100 isoform X1 [Momordica charantia]XP_022139831.1 pentatricopeptide repeat-containing protein At5g46100 isoform X1 [Momordica charantia]